MKQIKIARTSALARLRTRLSHPVRHLNTIVVGLNGIRDGTVNKAADLSVRWEVGDPIRTTDEARGFAIASLMIAACDALDQYLYGLGSVSSPIKDLNLRSLLRGETRIAWNESSLPTTTDLEKITQKLLASDSKDGRVALREFTERHYGKAIKASLRARFEEVLKYVNTLPQNASAPAKVTASYSAAITLLIVWRNKIVHEDSQDNLDVKKHQALLNDAEFFKNNHAAIEIAQTLSHFEEGQLPTLKDVSTLVSILLRTVATVDASIIHGTDLLEYFRETAWSAIREVEYQSSFIKKLRVATLDGRIKKLMPLLAGSGFVPCSFADKSKSYPPHFIDLEKTFIGTDEELDFLTSSVYIPAAKF